MIKLLKTYAEQIKSLLNLNVSTYLKKTREEFTTQLIKGHARTSGIQFMPGFSDYFNLQNPNPMDSKEIEPYVDFAHEPNPIIQLKTVINILYHFEVVFRELEEHKDFNLSTFDILLDSYTIWEKKPLIELTMQAN